MRVGPIAHGALLVAALVFAYQTWTRDTTEAPKVGSVTVWQESMDDFESFAFDGENKSVRVERRQEGDQSFYWGQVTRTEKKAKPRVPVKAPDESDKGAGDGHGHPGMPPGVGGHGKPKPGGAAAPTPPGKTGPATPSAPAPAKDSKAAPARPAGAGAGSSTKPPAQGLSPHHAGTDQEKKPGTPPAQPGAQPAGGAAKPAGDKPADKPAGDKPAGKPADKPAGDKPADKPAGDQTAAGGTGGEAAEGDEGDEGDGESAPETPEETTSKVTEFPIGKGGQTLIANLVHLRALRDLGVLTDAQKEEYALVDSKENLTVFFKNKVQHSLIIGSRIFGGGDRYVMNAETGRGYVLSNSEIMRHVDGAENSLGIKNLHSFQENAEDTKATTPGEQQASKKKDKFPGVGQVEMEATQGTRAFVRHEKTDAESGGTIIGWADKTKPGEADMTFDNFLAQIERLKPVEYDATLDASKLTKVLTLRYKSSGGGLMGTFELYRKEPTVTPEIEPSEETKRRNQPDYYVKTELTRVPGKISRMAAERVTEDVPQLFGAPPKKKDTKARPGGVVPAPAAGQPAGKTPSGKAAPAPSGADNAAGGAADKKGQDKAGTGKGAPAGPSANPSGSKSNPTEGNK